MVKPIDAGRWNVPSNLNFRLGKAADQRVDQIIRVVSRVTSQETQSTSGLFPALACRKANEQLPRKSTDRLDSYPQHGRVGDGRILPLFRQRFERNSQIGALRPDIFRY